MREIKFRAWDKLANNWVTISSISPKGNVRTWGAGVSAGVHSHPTENHLNDVVLMQYTGLKDKNGREVYEGDLVKRINKNCVGVNSHLNGKYNEDGLIEKVEWILSGFSVCARERNIPLWWIERDYDFEIIGNIYENPELIS